MNSVTIVGFVGADPEQRQARNNVQNSPFFPSLHNAPGKTQKTNGSRKSSGIASRFSALRLAESVLNSIKKGAHVLVEGELVSSTYERPNGKSKKSATTKITSWCIRADIVRKLDRGEPEPEVNASGSTASDHASRLIGHSSVLTLQVSRASASRRGPLFFSERS